jgi:alkane 1-monooxygenase
MLVHHRDVATPRDPVTARMGEHFYRYLPSVLSSSFLLALGSEAAILARKDLSATDRGNPFWRYAALQGSFLLLAFILGGWVGVGLFLSQASTPIWQL